MKTTTRKWSSMQTDWHNRGMESAWLRSIVSSSSLVRLTGRILDICSRLGLSVSLDMVRIRRVNTQRNMFLVLN